MKLLGQKMHIITLWYVLSKFPWERWCKVLPQPILFISHSVYSEIFPKYSSFYELVFCILCQLFANLWTVAPRLSMGFSRQEYWSGLPCPSPGDLSDPGIEPGPPASQADSLPLSHQRNLRPIIRANVLHNKDFPHKEVKTWLVSISQSTDLKKKF